MHEKTISVVDSKALIALFGPRDQHLRRIRDALSVTVSVHDTRIHVKGDEQAVGRATEVLEQLQAIVQSQGAVGEDDVKRLLATVQNGGAAVAAAGQTIDVLHAGRKVRPKTPGQGHYIDAIKRHDLVFCTGPAGTGKTYLAVAMAVAALKQERIRKIVLVRPAVEAGESLGYLPGDLQAKINPYLRPLLDALREILDYETIRRFTDQDIVEVIPLAYMRGRTLNEAFIILDEAQNTTVAQMKMFLTRMGRDSKIVVSGDTTQVDLPPHTRSGLIDAVHRLKGIEGVAHVQLSNADIVRHRLVQEIVRAYESSEPKRRR